MNVLGFAFYGENIGHGSYYSRKYYKSYYHKYDNRRRATSSDGSRDMHSKSKGKGEDEQ